ncbi:MAG TPA: hypothetical protein P5244_13275 [Syntrophales bacterium]|nr:hypothetical protein [Syntrophales bacterium]
MGPGRFEDDGVHQIQRYARLAGDPWPVFRITDPPACYWLQAENLLHTLLGACRNHKNTQKPDEPYRIYVIDFARRRLS